MRNGSPTFTVDEALVAIGFGKFQLLVLLYAGMGWVSEAMEMMLLSFVGPAVQSLWNLSPRQESLVTSAVFAGMQVGSYAWGIVSDKHGRRKGFLITAVVTFIAGFLSAFAPNYTSLIVLRCLVGLGLGGAPVLASWFLEFIPAPNRGTWMVVFSAFWTMGTIAEASVAWLVMPSMGWRWLLALSSIPSSLLLLLYSLAPESPRFLWLQGQKAEARYLLERMARINRKQLPSGVLVTGVNSEFAERQNEPTEESYLLSPTVEKNSTILNKKDSNKSAISTILVLLSPELLTRTLLLWMVFFGTAFSYYGLVLLTTELNNGHSILSSVKMRFETSNDVSYREVLIASFAECPAILISALTVDRLGRKLSMSALFFLCFVFLLPLLFQQPQALKTAFLFCARTCVTATFTIVYIYAPEIYPTSVRSTGVGVASSVGRIGGILCPLVAVGLVHGHQQTSAIILFLIVSLLSGICVLLFPLETKGQDLSDSISGLEDVDSCAA